MDRIATRMGTKARTLVCGVRSNQQRADLPRHLEEQKRRAISILFVACLDSCDDVWSTVLSIPTSQAQRGVAKKTSVENESMR